MMRVIFVALFTFIFQLFFTALSLHLGPFAPAVLFAPAALVLVATQFSLFESLVTMLLLGFLMDCWIGSTIGVIMMVLVVLWGLSIAAIVWLGKPNFLIRTAFIFAFALAFRASIALALGIQGGSQGNWEWIQILIMPFFDVGIGVLFYSTTMRVLTLLRLCEFRENTSQRLSRRSPRISLD